METLSLHIDYLLQRHDCVTLPGLGSLLAHGVSAHYDAERGCWLPPMREISFNAAISRTDGLIARSVARRENISHEMGARRVEQSVMSLRKALDTEGSAMLGHTGRLCKDEHGTLVFEPSAGWSRATAAVRWLPEPRVDVCEAASRYMHYKASEEQRRRGHLLRRAASVAACVAVLLALAWVVADNFRYAGERQYASITPVRTESVIEHPGETSAPIVWHMRHHADAVVEVDQNLPEVSAASGRYYLIVASLANKGEALDFMKLHKDEKLGLINSDGRYRVYVAKAATANELYTRAADADMKRVFPQSWVLKY